MLLHNRPCGQFCILAADSRYDRDYAIVLKEHELSFAGRKRAALPFAHQWRDLPFHGRDDRNLAHAFTVATCAAVSPYPCAWNQSIARRNASSTGKTLYPSSRSAFADDANIFLRPIFTASIVARGSLPRTMPVKNWSNTANPMATACGTFSLGAGSPVSAESLSRICFNVRFSPPRI